MQNMVQYIHTVEYNTALKKKEILHLARLWVNLKDIVLNAVSQKLKDK